jgi:hypothetical protein
MKSIADLEYQPPRNPLLSVSEGEKEITNHEEPEEPDCPCNYGLPCKFHDRGLWMAYIKEVMSRRL